MLCYLGICWASCFTFVYVCW